MRYVPVLAVLAGGLALLAQPLTAQMKHRPVAERLGYVPHPQVMRLVAADQKLSTAAYVVFRTMMYFGGLSAVGERRIPVPVDYDGVLQNMRAAVEIDPYNMDAYYFSQAILAWDVRNVEEANRLLLRGMEHRTWDFYLPLFVGFNAAYFLHDYDMAARYYQRAGELSGSELYKNLSARYLYEAKDTEHAIAYMRSMVKSARNADVRKTFETRLQALEAIREIEAALERYVEDFARPPTAIEVLLAKGYLAGLPHDPYGGEFFLDAAGRVRTTSRLAFGRR